MTKSVNLDSQFLERCRNVTKKFEDSEEWTVESQVLHMFEEVGEVHRALKEGDFENFQEECCDVILATITLFDMFRIPFENIQETLEETLQKVENRHGVGRRLRVTLKEKSSDGV